MDSRIARDPRVVAGGKRPAYAWVGRMHNMHPDEPPVDRHCFQRRPHPSPNYPGGFGGDAGFRRRKLGPFREAARIIKASEQVPVNILDPPHLPEKKCTIFSGVSRGKISSHRPPKVSEPPRPFEFCPRWSHPVIASGGEKRL